MEDYDANYNKAGGFDAEKPCTVELNGRTIEVTHHFTSENNTLLFLYVGARCEEIDIAVPLRSDKPAYARSEKGARALGLDTLERVEESQHVSWRGVTWTVTSTCAGAVEIDSEATGQKRRIVPVSEVETLTCDVCGSRSQTFGRTCRGCRNRDEDSNHGKRLVTDGGRDAGDAVEIIGGYEPEIGETVYRYEEELGTIVDVLPVQRKEDTWRGETYAVETPARLRLEPAAGLPLDHVYFDHPGIMRCDGADHCQERGYPRGDVRADVIVHCDECGAMHFNPHEELARRLAGSECECEVNDDNSDDANAGKKLITDGGRDVDDDADGNGDWEMSDEDIEALHNAAIAPDADDADGDDSDGDVLDPNAAETRDEYERRKQQLDADEDEDVDGDGFIVNDAGVRVATPRGLGDVLKPGKMGKFECTVCGAVTDSKHGAKSHFGRIHPEATADDVDDAIADADADADDGVGVVLGDELVDDADADADAVPDAWLNAVNTYVDARTQSIPVTLADARDAVVTALMNECDWMSIVERCEPGKHYDLHRWDDEEGWTDDAGKYISEQTAKYLQSTASDTEIKHYRSQLARRNYVTQDTVNGKTSENLLIPVGNGVINVDAIEYDAATRTIDMDTVNVEPMRKENRFIYRIETDWDPDNADVAGLYEWLEEVIHAEDERRVLCEFAGHALHPRYPADGFGILAGRGGSGKSQVLETLKAMIGSDNVGVRTLKQIETSDFASGKPIPNCRANINTELEGEQLPKLGTLKTYSAGEELEIEPKGEPAYKGKNDATMLFASDDPPRFPQDNRALGRRLYVIEFPCIYKDNPDPNDPLQLQAQGKTEVQEKLQSDERLSAMLVRAVEGLVRLLEEDDFTSEKTWQARVAQYEAYSDPVHDFARHALEADENGQGISSGDLKMTFDAFADAHDHSGKKIAQIIDTLGEMPGFPITKTRTRTFSDRQDRETVYEGIAFCEDAIDAWVPGAARHLYRDDDADDVESGYATETLADIKNDNVLGERDAVKVTVHTASGRTSYGRAEEGVLTGKNDSMQYYVPAMGGISLEEGEEYIIEGALAVEENDDTKLQLLPGMTDVTPIVRGNEDGQDDLDDDGDEVVNDTDADVDAKVRQTIDYKVSMRDAVDIVTVANIAGELAGRMDPDTVEDAVERLVDAGEIMRDDAGRVAIARDDDVGVIDLDDSTQNEREDGVRGIVTALEKQREDGAAVADVIETVGEDMGLTSDDARATLDRLKRKGDVYEPSEGHLRAIGGD